MPGHAPTVSVVMAVRDGSAHIREAIESILEQTLEDLELIVVDDGSRDGTPDVETLSTLWARSTRPPSRASA